jgi:hypothetical protein
LEGAEGAVARQTCDCLRAEYREFRRFDLSGYSLPDGSDGLGLNLSFAFATRVPEATLGAVDREVGSGSGPGGIGSSVLLCVTKSTTKPVSHSFQ